MCSLHCPAWASGPVAMLPPWRGRSGGFGQGLESLILQAGKCSLCSCRMLAKVENPSLPGGLGCGLLTGPRLSHHFFQWMLLWFVFHVLCISRGCSSSGLKGNDFWVRHGSSDQDGECGYTVRCLLALLRSVIVPGFFRLVSCPLDHAFDVGD